MSHTAKKGKEPCPYGCGKLLASQGRAPHIGKMHPGMPTKPGLDGRWPSTDPLVAPEIVHIVGQSTSDFLTRALDSVKSRRLQLKVKLDEVARLEAEDRDLGSEQEVLQAALDQVAGRRVDAGDHPSINEAQRSRSHQRGVGPTV